MACGGVGRAVVWLFGLLLLAGRGGRVWAAASAAWRAQLVWRVEGASGAAGLHGAAAIVEGHSRTLEMLTLLHTMRFYASLSFTQ